MNGNPSVESGYLNDPAKFSTLRSALAVPLEGVNGVIGSLTLYRADKDAFSRDHLRILLAISSKVSLAIENALRFQLAEDSATTDYLTLLPNARSLFLRLDSELARCRRTLEPLTVLVCDVDGFKQVNDRFGHLEGNKVLRYVADVLRENCREYDYVARMGGDEFVILLPGSDREAVYRRISEFQSIACDDTGTRARRRRDHLERGRSVLSRRRLGCRAVARRSRPPDVQIEAPEQGRHEPTGSTCCRRGQAETIERRWPASRELMRILKHLARLLLSLAVTVLIGGFLTAALVRLSPGFGVDEHELDPTRDARLCARRRPARPNRAIS